MNLEPAQNHLVLPMEQRSVKLMRAKTEPGIEMIDVNDEEHMAVDF